MEVCDRVYLNVTMAAVCVGIKFQIAHDAGLRPFGVSFLFAGWDKHFGFQLYHRQAICDEPLWLCKGVINCGSVTDIIWVTIF